MIGRSASPVAYLSLATIYAALLAYGTLFPLDAWIPAPGHSPLEVLKAWPRRLSLSDATLNLIVYGPLGVLLGAALRTRLSVAPAITVTVLCGFLLSLGLEFLQFHVPGRTPSASDLLLNSLGTLAGATITAPPRETLNRWLPLGRWRRNTLREGALTHAVIAILVAWSLTGLLPLVPTVDLGLLRGALAPIAKVTADPALFRPGKFAANALQILTLACLALIVRRPGRSILPAFALLACVTVLGSVPVVTRQLTAEWLAALVAALALMPLLSRASQRGAAWFGLLAGLLQVIIDSLTPSSFPGATGLFNWVPFAGHLLGGAGIVGLLATIWPYCALACLAGVALGGGWRRGLIGAAALAALVFALEWAQTGIRGRHADVSDVILAAAGWAVAWWYVQRGTPGGAVEPLLPPPASGWRGRRWSPLPVAISIVLLAATLAGSLFVLRLPPAEIRVNESTLPKIPAPQQAPPFSLPRFVTEHPRLPAPNAAELRRLRDDGQGFLQAIRRLADRGKIDAIVTLAYIEPGSQDLDTLEQRLLAMQFTWRGHDQLKPLAHAYDWLHGQWRPEQRARLRDKLIEGCNYVIERIRDQRLSPYNVILYNAPLQALMACALAVYRDDPRAEPIMAFTYDYWMRRVLPVWDQVMGRNGGWHEGGEYVGIGIGDAVYQLPAMWRSATGEDLFTGASALRGFLDFLIYRTRPDGTHMRWGDAGHYDRRAPDRLALALEYRHAAGYSFLGRPRAPLPTSWPWGPLTDDALYDPEATHLLPLSRFFDGIGLLVARSSWDTDATYVTFKAGNNYWSHSHLDQGAFTIFKGGALAIDSGLYGPRYGSDHHMNYTYQAIAHNVVVVPDPADTVPAPGKEQPRPIANDGGQRRIGSGWGVEAAPLDLAEWQDKYPIYHTADVLSRIENEDLAAVVADLTPAYTNARSGTGTFSHRTRRVERYLRTFVYDRALDAVIVHDSIDTANGHLRPRWLLHTIEAPAVDGKTFRVRAPASAPGVADGWLTGEVVLPEAAYINVLGGPGFEFFVEDRNYDEGGAVQKLAKRPRGAEPGAWRIEILPEQGGTQTEFLVVIRPSLGAPAPLQATTERAEDGLTLTLGDPAGTTHLRFDPQAAGAAVTVERGAQSRRYDLRVTAPRPAP